MSRLVESIKIKNGRIYNLAAHQARIDRSRVACFGCTDRISLREIITGNNIPPNGLYKCRVIYHTTVESVTFSPYHYPDIRTLKIVRDPDIIYDYKWAERPGLDALFRQKGATDEIIIIKNGWVTDAYYYNLVFEKNGQFRTPDTPLLRGTKRERLLSTDRISTARIAEQDIVTFEKIHLINAMTDLGQIVLSVKNSLPDM